MDTWISHLASWFKPNFESSVHQVFSRRDVQVEDWCPRLQILQYIWLRSSFQSSVSSRFSEPRFLFQHMLPKVFSWNLNCHDLWPKSAEKSSPKSQKKFSAADPMNFQCFFHAVLLISIDINTAIITNLCLTTLKKNTQVLTSWNCFGHPKLFLWNRLMMLMSLSNKFKYVFSRKIWDNPSLTNCFQTGGSTTQLPWQNNKCQVQGMQLSTNISPSVMFDVNWWFMKEDRPWFQGHSE